MSYDPGRGFDLGVQLAEAGLAREPRALEAFRKAAAAVDRELYAGLQKKHLGDGGYDAMGALKYLDLPFWLAHHALTAVRLDLDQRPPLRILDIGMGAGCFGAVCQALGHHFVGIDIEEPLYTDTAALLGLDRRIHAVHRRKRLPDLGGRFDLATATWVSFEALYAADGERIWWPIADWAFLIQDLLDNQLALPGELYVQLNQQGPSDGCNAYDIALLEWLADRGAACDFERGFFRFRFEAPMRLYPVTPRPRAA